MPLPDRASPSRSEGRPWQQGTAAGTSSTRRRMRMNSRPWTCCARTCLTPRRFARGRISSSSPKMAASTKSTPWWSPATASTWLKSSTGPATSAGTKIAGLCVRQAVGNAMRKTRCYWPTAKPANSSRYWVASGPSKRARCPISRPLSSCPSRTANWRLMRLLPSTSICARMLATGTAHIASSTSSRGVPPRPKAVPVSVAMPTARWGGRWTNSACVSAPAPRRSATTSLSA